jgi:hypothetical protein
MKPLFTVHAGEYLVGSHIEAKYPKWNVWIPSKDTGVDLLVTNARGTKSVSLPGEILKRLQPHPSSNPSPKQAYGRWMVDTSRKEDQGFTSGFLGIRSSLVHGTRD